ncbi:MAG: molecular chaperone DnaJ [Acidimicrobiales bacterium]
MASSDYYELLGVDRNASANDIKRAYRRLAKELHPDVRPGDADAEARFKAITTAYETLSDPDRRARYDRFGPEAGAGGDPFGATGFGDIFDAFFGGMGFGGGGQRGPSGPPRGVDLEASLELAFEEAVFGVKRDVTVRTAVACEECGGSGAAPGTSPQTCPDCRGAGQVRQVRQSILGKMVTSAPCGRCQGQGAVILAPCPACTDGRVLDSRSYTVDVPAGVDNGTTLRLTGRGAVGPRGGPPGDLYVHLAVRPHAHLRREGNDLVHRLRIPFTQAALGAKLVYETLDGDTELTIRRGVQSGETFVLRGKGVPHVQGRGRGDLRIELAVETPTELSDREEKLLRELADLRGEEVAEPEAGFFAKLRSAFGAGE